jgi:hypothetical protein
MQKIQLGQAGFKKKVVPDLLQKIDHHILTNIQFPFLLNYIILLNRWHVTSQTAGFFHM